MMKMSGIWFAVLLSACGTGERSTPARATTSDVVAPIAVATPAPDAPAPEIVIPAPVMTVTAEAPKPLPTKFTEAMEDGRAAIAKNDVAHARELFEAAAKLDKKSAEPHIELARMFIASKDKALAIAAANKAVKLAPDSTRTWNTLGRAQLAVWDYAKASTAFKKAAELDPDNAWAWNNLGYTELEFKSYQAAVDALVVATSKPNATGFMWNNLGTAYEHLDLLDEAREAFEKGGKVGSKEALASRKRLEGVTPMIAVYKEKKVETTYAHDEDPNETAQEVPPPDAGVEIDESPSATATH
jgi:tetratricopeptide (TPR) repeat protein